MSTQAIVKSETAEVVNEAKESDRLTNLQRLGNILSASGYFSDAREMAQAAVKVMAGEELGIPPIASMMGVNIIKGKVALGGNLIASRILAHGYGYRVTRHDTKGCVIEFRSKPDADGKRTALGESSFTEDDAKTAQVFTDMYKKYPKNMYFNRAISNGAKWFTPDVFGGAPVYVPEELGVQVDSEGDVVHTPGAPPDEPPKPATPPKQPAPTPKEASVEDEELQALWGRIKGKKSCVDVFGELHSELTTLCGADGDVQYYGVLKAHGVEHSNGFSKLQDARNAAKDLLGIIRTARDIAAQEPPAEQPSLLGDEPSAPETGDTYGPG